MIALGPLPAIAAKPSAPAHGAASLNDYTLTDIIASIGCLPHDPDTQSTSNAKDAVRDGVADIEAGHCVKAVADFQYAIDADPTAVDALWRQELVAFQQALLTSDVGLSVRLLETAYHDMDLAIAAAPKNPVFYVMRASTRLHLLPARLKKKNAFTMHKFIDAEYKSSYDDLTSAITLSPQYGEAYAYRFLVDGARHDAETARFDLGKAQQLNPRGAQEVEESYRLGQQRVAEYNEERARRSMAMANAMMGLAAATGGGYVVPVYQP